MAAVAPSAARRYGGGPREAKSSGIVPPSSNAAHAPTSRSSAPSGVSGTRGGRELRGVAQAPLGVARLGQGQAVHRLAVRRARVLGGEHLARVLRASQGREAQRELGLDLLAQPSVERQVEQVLELPHRLAVAPQQRAPADAQRVGGDGAPAQAEALGLPLDGRQPVQQRVDLGLVGVERPAGEARPLRRRRGVALGAARCRGLPGRAPRRPGSSRM